jgi:hypothetical protein
VPSVITRLVNLLAGRRPWHDLPRYLAMFRLIAIRDELRLRNLHDTEEPAHETADAAGPPACTRPIDGLGTDPRTPRMGIAGARFGRNVALEHVQCDPARLLDPNPRVVADELLARRTFQPATSLNLLAAAWIQFMVHDWFVHRLGAATDCIEVPLQDSDSWHERPMRIVRTAVDPPRLPGSSRPAAFVNDNSHWWDGSQIYGSDPQTAARIRMGERGKIRVGEHGRLPIDPASGREITGFTDNGWIGLSMLHGLFAQEHNAICDRLALEHDWDDERLFQTARLVNAALMAKIHTIEWTPAILPHPVVRTAMRTNWHGLLGKRAQAWFPWLNANELLGGLVGSPTDHHGVPFALTEEFVAVYRMHPLIPDAFTFRSAETHREIARHALPEISGRRGLGVRDAIGQADLFYSFGQMHPGAIRLNNFPTSLRDIERPDGSRLDLACVDIVRDRERGVPRYNQFRRLLHKPPVTSFEELAGDATLARRISDVYRGDLEAVDLMVGLFAEPLPPGFGFSETAFRVFVLMASRRLKSDRFFTTDYTAEVYTQAGLDWIEENAFTTVIARHMPTLRTLLAGVANGFAPWPSRPASS